MVEALAVVVLAQLLGLVAMVALEVAVVAYFLALAVDKQPLTAVALTTTAVMVEMLTV
jgi:hypothetical protein